MASRSTSSTRLRISDEKVQALKWVEGYVLKVSHGGEWHSAECAKLTDAGVKMNFTEDNTSCLVYYADIKTRIKRERRLDPLSPASPPATPKGTTPAKKKAAAQNLNTAKRAAASASSASSASSSASWDSAAEPAKKSARKVKFKPPESTDHTDRTAISDLQVWIASKTVADGEPTILGLFDSEEAALEACKKCAKQVVKVYADPLEGEGPMKRAIPQSASFFKMLFRSPLPWVHDDVDKIVTTISICGPQNVQISGKSWAAC